MSDAANTKQGEYSARLTQAVDQLRGNVKWTLAAFGAIGTTLLAGSQLSSIGKFQLSDWRLWVALGCAVVALGAASYAVRSALKVAFAGYTELNDLSEADRKYAEGNTAMLDGFKDIEEIKQAYYDCIQTRHAHLTKGTKATTVQGDNANFRYLDGLVDDILSFIRYRRISEQAHESAKELGAASIVAAVGLVGFAWAANPPSDKPIVVLQSLPSPARLTLTDAGRKALSPVLGQNCASAEKIDVIVLSATTAGSEVLSNRNKDCAMVRFTVTDAVGTLAPP